MLLLVLVGLLVWVPLVAGVFALCASAARGDVELAEQEAPRVIELEGLGRARRFSA